MKYKASRAFYLGRKRIKTGDIIEDVSLELGRNLQKNNVAEPVPDSDGDEHGVIEEKHDIVPNGDGDVIDNDTAVVDGNDDDNDSNRSPSETGKTQSEQNDGADVNIASNKSKRGKGKKVDLNAETDTDANAEGAQGVPTD